MNKSCKFTHHFKWLSDSAGISNPVYNIEKSKLKREIINYLREHNFLGNRANFLCQSCLNKRENLIGIQPSSILQSKRTYQLSESRNPLNTFKNSC